MATESKACGCHQRIEKRTFVNLKAVLGAGGRQLADIIDLTYSHTDPEAQFAKFMAATAEFFPVTPYSNWPASRRPRGHASVRSPRWAKE